MTNGIVEGVANTYCWNRCTWLAHQLQCLCVCSSATLEVFGGKLFWQASVGNITVTDTRGLHPAVMALQTGATRRVAFCIDHGNKDGMCVINSERKNCSSKSFAKVLFSIDMKLSRQATLQKWFLRNQCKCAVISFVVPAIQSVWSPQCTQWYWKNGGPNWRYHTL